MRTRKNWDKYSLYLQAFQNTAKAYREGQGPNEKPYITKLIVYGVKAVNAKPAADYTTWEETVSDFQFICTIKDLIGTITPAEFMTIFPIEKEYQGHRWGMKDYFYTRDYINTLDPDKPIGEATDPLEFMWEYTNWEIREFNVAIMSCMSNLRKLEGYPSLADEWADMNGIRTYSMHTDQKGREYLYDGDTGKTIRVKRKRPRYFKVVK